MSFNFLMLSAMYENGGNTTQRFLDGHPELMVYPFESQVGTRFVDDSLSKMFPLKYRWPEFLLSANSFQDYKAIIDEEGKMRALTPHVSKFRHAAFEMNDGHRCELYQAYVQKSGRGRGQNVEAFFRATFDAWKNFKRSGRESVYVGYSPIVVVDAPKIVEDLPGGHVLHVVRNPWSAYADTKKRPVPMSLEKYLEAWNINQHYALLYQKKYPGRVHIVRCEDVLENSVKALTPVCSALGISPDDALKRVSWNGEELQEVYPWGTIRKATPEANLATARELSPAEADEVRQRTWQYLDVFDYAAFSKKIG
jgi:hypothetical protein